MKMKNFYQVAIATVMALAACKSNPTPTVPAAADKTAALPSNLYDMRTDTFTVYGLSTIGAEFRLENATRHLTGGLLTNTTDNGLTEFRKLKLTAAGTTGIGIIGQDSIALDKLQWYLPITGGVLSAGMSIVNTGASPKIWLAQYTAGTGHTGAPKTFDKASTYLAIGGREYGANSYRSIGFGYVSSLSDQYPALVGYQETATTGNTMGDLVFGTRNSTSSVAPTIRFRITGAGAVKSYATPQADEDVSTRKYTDQVTVAIKAATYALTAGDSRSVLVNKGATGAVTYTLPAAAPGLQYTFVQYAAQAVVIKAAPTDQIAGATGLSAVAGTLTGTGAGTGSVTVVGIDATRWAVTSAIGTWTVK